MFESPERLAETIADDICEIIRSALRRRGRALVTASTGRTFVQTYRILRERHAGRIDWGRVTLIQMDEYADRVDRRIGPLAVQLRRELATPLGIGAFVPLCAEGDRFLRSCRRLDDFIGRHGGFDLAVHGIGGNGHVGFNEPGARRNSPTRIVTLAPETRKANFGDDPNAPRRALTLGLDVLGRARCSLLAACGPAKSDAVARLLSGEPARLLPAATIRRSPRRRVYLDAAAHGDVAPERALRFA